MGVLDGFEPRKVLKYFEEICGIPHGSGNTKQISDYLAGFAAERGLRYIQDEYNNVVIYQEGTGDRAGSAPVILQGHMDMVCEKEDWCDKDMEHEHIDLEVTETFEAAWISAKGTTLGGDDGIAVAYMLAILDSPEIVHPPLECVFTVDEEIGMLGAAAMDMSCLSGRTMINLDSEEEGYILASCAGGATVTVHLPVMTDKTESGTALTVTVSGLYGGHSGTEIDKGRAIANVVIGRALYNIRKQDATLRLADIHGGLKDNAISRRCDAVIVTENPDGIRSVAEKLTELLRNEYKYTEPGIQVSVTESEMPETAFDIYSTDRVITALMNLPYGIQSMSLDIKGLVETSLNPGILVTVPEDSEVQISYSVRSSVGSRKQELIDRLESLAVFLDGYITSMGDYPAWEYAPESRLRDIITEVFDEQYGREPVVQALHAGVECGLFAGNLPGLDAVSIGPDMVDIHTPQEHMIIDSVQRTWELLLETLKRL